MSLSYRFENVPEKHIYYDVVHASVAVKPGAVLIGTDGYTAKSVQYLAFRNPDGSYGILILNESGSEATFVFTSSAHSVTVKSPSMSVQSVTWKD